MLCLSDQVVKPRSSGATSVPGLLSLFHNEWDALMLETATLREALDARNKELATALYQYDAACRVIARLAKERDEARAGATAVEAPAPAAAAPKRGAGDAPPPAAKKAKGGIPKETEAALEAHAMELSKTRRKRMASPDLANVEQLGSYVVGDTLPLHSSAHPGICGISLHRGGDVVATCGVDTSCVVFSRSAAKKLSELKGHTKEVGALAFVGGDPLVSGGADGTVRLWRPKTGGDLSSGYSCAAVLKHHHASSVTTIAAHPLGQHCASGAADGSWAFVDVTAAECLSHVNDAAAATAPHGGLGCASFHPDGLLLGTGSGDGVIRLWDVKTGTSPAAMTGHTGGAVTSLSFSENGYHVASAGGDGVRVWDLRKQKCILHLAPDAAAATTCAVSYDYSGAYLAMGALNGGVSVHATRNELARVAAWEPSTAAQASRVTALAWGPHAQFLAVGARGDHNLRVLAAPK